MSEPQGWANFALGDPGEPTESLPRSDLNPLINPVLGKNLGRWAHVYFTSPPERREEAVEQLLRELESGSEAGVETHRSVENAPLKRITEIHQQRFCPACQGVNQADECFCGYCGRPLKEEHERAWRIDTQVPASPVGPSAIADGEVEWLRDKTLAGFEQPAGPRRRGLLYLMIGVAILLAAFSYLEWTSLNQSRPTPQPAAGFSTHASAVKETHEISAPAPKQAATVTIQSSPPTSGGPERISQAFKNSISQKVGGTDRVAHTSPSTGPDELASGEELLDGRNGVRDSAQAAQLLWKGVSRQNPKAALALAELYARGDGVAKNCDQARLLLVAAAKKGLSAAGTRLRRLEAEGCQ